MAKTKSDTLEKDTKSSIKKSKVKDELLEPKVDVEQSLIATSELAEIDLRGYSHSDTSGVYIRRKRHI